jgi:hypothetical protein
VFRKAYKICLPNGIPLVIVYNYRYGKMEHTKIIKIVDYPDRV